MNLLEDLNPEQKSAVTHTTGPLMIVAGAGTGKTTVVTRRIAWLIEQGFAKPEQILSLTFTDKAAGEMEERVDQLLPYGYVDLQISTFHAFCERLLREYGAEMGLARDFKLSTELDTWLLMRQHFDKFELDYYRPLGNPTKYLKGFLTHFSRLKDQAIEPNRYLSFVEVCDIDKDEDIETERKRLKELAGAYQTYQSILQEHDALDFGDLILYSLKLLRDRPRILKLVREKFQFVLVDEFQDTNLAQYELVKLIAAPKNNLTIVGDDDQSIYHFRGASLENILRFETDFPDTTRVVLTKNYRSAQSILDHAHTFIQMNNPHRLESKSGLTKRLIAHSEHSGNIEHIHCSTLEDEVLSVIKKIVDLKEQDQELSWNDFAILVRSNSAGDDFASAFDRHGIPFQFLALSGLYTKPVILDLVAFMQVIDRPFESPSFYRVLTSPMYGIDARSIAELNLLAQKKGKSLFEASESAGSIENLSSEVQEKLKTILSQLNDLRVSLKGKPATECFKQLVRKLGYIEYLNARPEAEKMESFRYLNQFLDRVKSFETRNEQKNLHTFLEEFKNEREAGEEGSLSVDFETGPELVRIMTVHASKGLEFKHVFIVNLVDRRFPAQARGESIPIPDGLFESTIEHDDAHLHEERRLFYVAMTRAKEGLYFTSADDYGGSRARKLSKFLHELGYEKPDGKDRALIHVFDEDRGEQEEHVSKSEISIPVPKQFSFTQLAAFKTCPYQYKFAHVLKVPVFGRWTFSFGKTMHNTLQAYFTAWLERAGKKQSSLFDIGSDYPVSKDELLDLFAHHWIDDWYEDDVQREQYREKGIESLLAYFDSFATKRPSPLFLEQGFTLKFGDVVLKGRIDRMDAFEDGVEIIDYKTGSPKTDKTLKPEDREQLYLYQMAAIDVLGLNPKKLTYHYMEDNSEVSFLASDDQLAELRQNIIDRVQMIRKSVFEPTPGFHCRFCDFADICEFRQ